MKRRNKKDHWIRKEIKMIVIGKDKISKIEIIKPRETKTKMTKTKAKTETRIVTEIKIRIKITEIKTTATTIITRITMKRIRQIKKTAMIKTKTETTRTGKTKARAKRNLT